MAEKSKIREITITDDKGTFNAILRKFSGGKDYDFEALTMLRRLLSNEKARILHFLKTEKPASIYELAKMVGRDFKSVSEDIKLLENFGFVETVREKTGKRERLRPVLAAHTMQINIKI